MIKTKYNDATNNRPDGERVIDASYVFSDIPAFAKQIREEKSWIEGDRNAITVFKSSAMTIVLMAIKADARIEDNESDDYITIQVLEGRVDASTTEGDMAMTRQQIVTFHPEIRHSIQAKEESLLLITTHHPAQPK